MERSPLPRTWRGWVAALAVVAIAFAVYYLLFFPHLLSFYGKALYSSSVFSEDKEPIRGRLLFFFKVSTPMHVGSFGNRWIYLEIFNVGDEALEDVRVWLKLEKQDDTDADKKIWQGFVGEPSLLKAPPSGELHFTRINSRETVWGRLPVYAKGSFTGCVAIQVPQAQEPLKEVCNLNFVQDEAKFLAHAVVENILLPPWSNGLLLGLALGVSYLAECRRKESDDSRRDGQDSMREASDLFRIGLLVLEGLKYLAFFWAILFAVIALPWVFSWWENSLLLIIFGVWCVVVWGVVYWRRLKGLWERISHRIPEKWRSRLRTFIKGLWECISHRIPERWRSRLRTFVKKLVAGLVLFVVGLPLDKWFSDVAYRGTNIDPLIYLAGMNLFAGGLLYVILNQSIEGPPSPQSD